MSNKFFGEFIVSTYFVSSISILNHNCKYDSSEELGNQLFSVILKNVNATNYEHTAIFFSPMSSSH